MKIHLQNEQISRILASLHEETGAGTRSCFLHRFPGFLSLAVRIGIRIQVLPAILILLGVINHADMIYE